MKIACNLSYIIKMNIYNYPAGSGSFPRPGSLLKIEEKYNGEIENYPMR